MAFFAKGMEPHVVAALLGVIGVLLVLCARMIQRWLIRWHHRLRRATRASSWLIRVTGWHHEFALILFGIMLVLGGLGLFLLTYPWDEV